MTVAVRTATGLKSVATFKVRDASNTLRTVEKAFIRTTNGLKQFFGQLAVALSQTTVQGSTNRAGSTGVSTRYVQATPQGGVAPFTYLWARTDGGAHSWTINSPTGAITNFSTTIGTNTEQVATFHCTVTDATGLTAVSADVTADCWNDGGGL